MLSRRVILQQRSAFSWSEVFKHSENKCVRQKSGKKGEGQPFRMILPPPNVTGVLHIGHALTVTIEDVVSRFQRLNNRNVEWIPGFDHAGIATQTAVEKMLWKKYQKQRHQMTIEEFLKHVQDWKELKASNITDQLQQLNTTLDWKKGFYTMDDKFKDAVNTAFVNLHNQKLIYRDHKMLNWCPSLKSTISDEEVELKKVENYVSIPNPSGGTRKVRVGVLHKVKYKLVGANAIDPKYLEVATTRPETIFADCALAVNPSDPVNSNFIGRFVINPLNSDKIPIIPSDLVDVTIGTGVLKVTPALNRVDYEIYSNADKKYNLKCKNVIDEKGCLTNVDEKFNGMDRFDVKEKVIAKLKSLNAYSGHVELPSTTLPICSRSGDLCEARLMQQWFLDTADVNEVTLKAVEKGEIKVDPDYGEFALSQWLEKKEPWCLSRQLVWGHQIPAYFAEGKGWTSAKSLKEAAKSLQVDIHNIKQDSDVLDTWFSSALAPIVVLSNWPQNSVQGSSLDLMETGHDITGFWVARMLTLCYALTGNFPFNRVSLHGMIRDSEGRKMSKSLGNVIDPLFIINGVTLPQMVDDLEQSNLPLEELESAINVYSKQYPSGIKAYGSDVLKFVLLRRNVQAHDVPVDLIPLAEEGFKLGNKLANMTKYVNMVTELVNTLETANVEPKQSVAEEWIQMRLRRTLKIYKQELEEVHTHPAFEALHQFLINDFCDVYLESTKKAFWKKDPARLLAIAKTLTEVSDVALKSWSVFMPMLSNYLLDQGDLKNADVIEFDKYLGSTSTDSNNLDRQMRLALNIIALLRSARSKLGFSEHTSLTATIMSDQLSSSFTDKFSAFMNDIANVQIDRVVQKSDVSENLNIISIPGTDALIVLHLDSVDPEVAIKIRSQLENRLSSANKRIEQLEALIKKYNRYVTELKKKEALTRGDEKQVQKHEKKAKQSEKSLVSTLNEQNKLQKLLAQINSNTNKKAEAI